MRSVMVFLGGPWDSREEEPEAGWPAPDGLKHRDFDGRYVRVQTYGVEGYVMRHVYKYEGPAAALHPDSAGPESPGEKPA